MDLSRLIEIYNVSTKNNLFLQPAEQRTMENEMDGKKTPLNINQIDILKAKTFVGKKF